MLLLLSVLNYLEIFMKSVLTLINITLDLTYSYKNVCNCNKKPKAIPMQSLF